MEDYVRKAALLLMVLFFYFLPAALWADSLILPGERIDGAYMNMPFEIVQKGWGPADEKEEVNGGIKIHKNKRYLTMLYEKEGLLVMLETFSSSFKTQSGIKVGSHRQDVTNSFGAPIDQENYSFICFDGQRRDLYSLIYKGEGIGFSFDPSTHKVYSIFVFPVGRYINVLHQ
jgi:hypothetical protein